jgi:hypothetical protein
MTDTGQRILLFWLMIIQILLNGSKGICRSKRRRKCDFNGSENCAIRPYSLKLIQNQTAWTQVSRCQQGGMPFGLGDGVAFNTTRFSHSF